MQSIFAEWYPKLYDMSFVFSSLQHDKGQPMCSVLECETLKYVRTL